MVLANVKKFLYTAMIRSSAIVIGIAIWLLSSQSTLPEIKGIFGFDKIQHIAAYFCFTLAVGLWFAPEKWQLQPRLPLCISLSIGALYGLIDEVHQYFVPGRASNLADWIADVLGAVLGSVAVWLVSKHILIRRIEKL